MSGRPVHRWFHTLVVTGASLTGCGDTTKEVPVGPGDAAKPVDGSSLEAQTPEAGMNASDSGRDDAMQSPEGGNDLPDSAQADATKDALDDYRCCVITR